MMLIIFFSLLDNCIGDIIGMRKHGQHSSGPCSVGIPWRHVPSWIIMTVVAIKSCSQGFQGNGADPRGRTAYI